MQKLASNKYSLFFSSLLSISVYAKNPQILILSKPEFKDCRTITHGANFRGERVKNTNPYTSLTQENHFLGVGIHVIERKPLMWSSLCMGIMYGLHGSFLPLRRYLKPYVQGPHGPAVASILSLFAFSIIILALGHCLTSTLCMIIF